MQTQKLTSAEIQACLTELFAAPNAEIRTGRFETKTEAAKCSGRCASGHCMVATESDLVDD